VSAIINDYITSIWNYRHFWIALAKMDLRARFRRTRIGILWVIIHPLLFTIMLGIVFKYVFNSSFLDLTVYIFSGIVLWNWIVESITYGSNIFIQSQAFIRQKRLPLFGYIVRSFIVSSIVFLISFIGMIFWYLFTGHRLGIFSAFLPFHILLIAITILPVIAFSSVLGTIHRDYQQLVLLILQLLWFMSPVFIDKNIFLNPGLQLWDSINPISSMLSLIRDPLIYNSIPNLSDYFSVLIFSLFSWIFSLYLLKKYECHIIYYL